MRTFSDVINEWPSVMALADDVQEKPATVRKWRTRNSIPAPRWIDLIHAGNQRGIKISTDELAKAAKAA